MIDDRADRAPMQIYQDYLKEGKLAYQYSPVAGKAVFYPRILCPFTGSDTLEWRLSAGWGVVHSLTIVSRRDEADHCIVLVDLDEGFRMLSRVDGIAAGQVRIGMRVRARVEKTDADWTQPHPTFLPEEAYDAR